MIQYFYNLTEPLKSLFLSFCYTNTESPCKHNGRHGSAVNFLYKRDIE